jgi:hypothetical protein
VTLQPPRFEERHLVLATVGLHALARRYERGEDLSDFSVLRDLAGFRRRWRRIVEAETDEFEVPTSTGGRWIGATMVYEGDQVLAVRTFC